MNLMETVLDKPFSEEIKTGERFKRMSGKKKINLNHDEKIIKVLFKVFLEVLPVYGRFCE